MARFTLASTRYISILDRASPIYHSFFLRQVRRLIVVEMWAPRLGGFVSINRDMPACVAASDISLAVTYRITFLPPPRAPLDCTLILSDRIRRNGPYFPILEAGVDSIWNAM